MHQVIAKNTFFQTIAKIFTAGTGFLITILIAKSFGAAGYGDFVKITTFTAFFYLAIDLGLNAVFLQEENGESKYKDLFYLRVLIAFITFLITNAIAFFLPYNLLLNTGFSENVKLGIFIFSFSFFSQAIILSTSALFQKKLTYFFYMLAIIIGSLINLAAVYFSTTVFSSLTTTIFALLLGGGITAFFAMIFLKKSVLPIKMDYQFSKRIIIKALPLSIMLIFNLVYFRADTFLLAFFKESKEVGIYGLSYKFFDFLIALPLFLSNSIYPLLLQNKKNFRKFNALTKTYLLVFLCAGIIFVIPFWFISPLFAMIKTEYLEAVLPFKILLLSLPIFFATSFLQWIFISLERQKFLMYIYFVSAVVNVVLNLIFIPKYSYFASAVITGISETIVFVVLLVSLFNLKIILEQEVQR
ncbi:oligosaccharide flippase family protein [Patescibacteria group bacterium]|nr:oligosaccharide flippase family protein [Patescibacteria group bacterium]